MSIEKDGCMSILTNKSLKEAVEGFYYPFFQIDEKWLNKWNIEYIEDDNIGSNFRFTERIYYKNVLVFVSKYSPFTGRSISVKNNSKWSELQNKIYQSHHDYISRRVGSI